VNVILDAGGVRALSRKRGLLAQFAARQAAPPQVPAVVLAEALTGDHRRDHDANSLLRYCEIVDIGENLAREGARMRTLTRRAGTITATDAIVVAFAASQPNPNVLTSDPKDLIALAEHAGAPVRISEI
jgi:predicted nucleic acid-binding protein